MNRNPKEKFARIDIRIKPKDKEKIKRIAEKCNLSVSEYVVQRALGYAPRTVRPDVFFDFYNKLCCTPNLSQAQRIKDLSMQGLFTGERLSAIMSEEKANQKERVKIPADRIRKYFPKDYTTAQIEETIIKLCEAYHRKRLRDRDSR